MNCNFSYSHYEYICNLIASNFTTTFYEEVKPNNNKNEVILRHDIDLGLKIENAIKFAKIENNYGLQSTYFVMVRSPFYNIFSPDESTILREIISLNHRIGLHFDETIYNINDLSLYDKYIYNEVFLLESFFNIEIKSVSMHRPSKEFINSNLEFDRLINTYDNFFIKTFKYISDSRRHWREGCCCNWLNDTTSLYNKYQINMHPFWWTEDDLDFEERFKKFINDYLNIIDFNLSENISNWQTQKLVEWIRNDKI